MLPEIAPLFVCTSPFDERAPYNSEQAGIRLVSPSDDTQLLQHRGMLLPQVWCSDGVVEHIRAKGLGQSALQPKIRTHLSKLIQQEYLSPCYTPTTRWKDLPVVR